MGKTKKSSKTPKVSEKVGENNRRTSEKETLKSLKDLEDFVENSVEDLNEPGYEGYPAGPNNKALKNL